MKKTDRYKIFIIAFTLSELLACGIKGPPLPPIETIGEKLNNASVAPAPEIIEEKPKAKKK